MKEEKLYTIAELKRLPEWSRIKHFIDQIMISFRRANPGRTVELREYTKYAWRIYIDGIADSEIDAVDIRNQIN